MTGHWLVEGYSYPPEYALWIYHVQAKTRHGAEASARACARRDGQLFPDYCRAVEVGAEPTPPKETP